MYLPLLYFISIAAIILADPLLLDKSVTCSASTIDVNLSFNEAFSGGIFTEKGISNKECRWKGVGTKNVQVRVPIHNSSHCGVASNQTAGTFWVKLLITPVDGLLVEGFEALNVRCVYSTQDITLTLPPGPNGTNALQILTEQEKEQSVVTGTGGSPSLSMQIIDGHGIDGEPVGRAAVGQRITLDIVFAHDGSNSPEASINIVDSDGLVFYCILPLKPSFLLYIRPGFIPCLFAFFSSASSPIFECIQRQLADKITSYASIDEIRVLLISGAQADGAVIHGLTPLHYACFINYIAAAKLLLNKGAKADAVDEIGCSALHLCAEHGHYRMIRLLLQYMEAVRQYETPEFTKGMRYPSRENIDEPLRLAIKNGHFECAKLLLENGANPNAIYFDGPEITQISPLDTNFIALLLEHGADPNVFDRKGLSPAMKACRMKDKGIEAIRILKEHGADLNLQAPERQDHRTALHFAILSGSHKLVQFLIENGSKINMESSYEKPSPIDIAVLRDDPELLKIVLDSGGDPNSVHTYIGSCLHLAACSHLVNQKAIIKMLLEHGADMNLQHKFADGSSLKSPFVEYFRSRDIVDVEIVRLFVSHGGKVVMKSPLHDCRGQLRNVLRLAAIRNQPEVLAIMLGLAEDFDVRAIDRLPLPDGLKGDILERARNPATLQQLCRLSIRQGLKSSEVDRLVIPVYLKKYLLGLIP